MRRVVITLLVLATLGLAVFWLVTMPASVDAHALASYAPQIENGKTMFYAGGCASCHATPEQEDKTRLGGGLELKSPYGSFYAPNISSDPKDGIGGWNEAQFVTAMQKGTSPDGRHYFPSFPYASYQRMKLEDVRDLFAFLKSLAPVPGKARDHAVGFPFNIRRVLGAWKLLYLDGKQFATDTARDAQWNRGAYLVNGPGHCVECHSPRDAFGGIIERYRFTGGPSPDGESSVPNITPAGIGSYSVGDIAEILATGTNPEGDSVGGVMAAVVRNTAQLSSEDRAAMAAYIKSLPALEGAPQPEKK